MTSTPFASLPLPDGGHLAFERIEGRAPEIVFLGGFASDMTGSKASHLAAWCRRTGRAFTRFDYEGHGASSGRFVDGSIGCWRDDALRIIDQVVRHRCILVGSSMGGWIMLLVALARSSRVAGMVGIAAAPDFVSRLVVPRLAEEQKAALARDGWFEAPSRWSPPLQIGRTLIEDAPAHDLLAGEGTIAIDCPVHLLHGQEDEEVPWATSLELAGRLRARHVTVELVKDGDHRLSRDTDLRRIEAAVERIIEAATQEDTGS